MDPKNDGNVKGESKFTSPYRLYDTSCLGFMERFNHVN